MIHDAFKPRPAHPLTQMDADLRECREERDRLRDDNAMLRARLKDLEGMLLRANESRLVSVQDNANGGRIVTIARGVVQAGQRASGM